jgi:hypothetical protein
MVIKVSFQKQKDSGDVDLSAEMTKFFEVEAMPEKPKVIGKLKEMGCRLEPTSVSIKIHLQDAGMMRSNGILVSRLY